MKEINYLSIQGKYAPYFYFGKPAAESFKTLVESELSTSPLVISSAYRTDIFFYASSEDEVDKIARKWCEVMGYHFDSHMKSKFISSSSKKRTFELYYDTLLYMLFNTKYFGIYKRSLDLVKRQHANHAILKELFSSEFKLSESYINQKFEHKTQIPHAKQLRVNKFYDLNSLARQGINQLIYN